MGGMLAWESWSNRTNSKSEACDIGAPGAPGAGAKFLGPRQRLSKRSEAHSAVVVHPPMDASMDVSMRNQFRKKTISK